MAGMFKSLHALTHIRHELQILFRMELLQSKITANFEENVKQKMIKEICLLLQNIEFYLQGDFLCGESLLEFAGRTIKSRYVVSAILLFQLRKSPLVVVWFLSPFAHHMLFSFLLYK